MTTQEPRVFTPNAVLIPQSAISGTTPPCTDPDECTLLYLDGDRLGGKLYDKNGWEQGGWKPRFLLIDDNYYEASSDLDPPVFCRAGLSIRDQEPVPLPRIALLPDMWVLKRDETEYWDEAFLKERRIKRIVGVYLLNKRKTVHLCEFTPSYELHRLDSQYEQGWEFDDPDYDRLNEKAFDDIRREEAHDEGVTYVHCSDVESMLKEVLRPHAGDLPKSSAGGYQWVGMKAVTEEDAIEEIREATNNGDL